MNIINSTLHFSFQQTQSGRNLNLFLNPTQKAIADFWVWPRDLNLTHSTLTGPMWEKGGRETLALLVLPSALAITLPVTLVSFQQTQSGRNLNLFLNPTQKAIADFWVWPRDLNLTHSTLTGPMWEKGGRETLALLVLPSALAINITCMHILWTFNSIQGKLHFTPCGLVIVCISPLWCT